MTVQQARKIQETATANLQNLSFGEQAMWTLIEHLDKRLALAERELDDARRKVA
jgi:hypothetical protein